MRGYYVCGGSRAGWERGTGTDASGDSKSTLTQPGGWSFSMTAMGEMRPCYENHVKLNHADKDQWGMLTLDIDCWSDNEDKMTRDAIERAKAVMKQVGVRGSAPYDGHFSLSLPDGYNPVPATDEQAGCAGITDNSHSAG